MVILEHINRKINGAKEVKDLLRSFKKGCFARLSKYIQKDSIFFLDADSRDEALKSMVDQLHSSGKLSNPRTFLHAVMEREKIISTGIGMGVAVPHAKLSDFPDFFIAIGIQKEKGLDWGALDNAPVQIIFLIGGPENQQKEYLQILSCLTQAIKNDEIRKSLIMSTSSDEVAQNLIKSAE